MLKGDAVAPSLNEVEALAAKAVRGAGAGWGTAEDVARAVRWMARHDLDWSGPLLRLLGSGAAAAELAPVFEIADRLAGARAGDAFALEAGVPVWIVAVLSGAVYGRDLAVEVAGVRWRVRLGPDGGISTDSDRTETLLPGAVEVRVLADGPPLPYAVAATATRRTVPASVWSELEGYAAQTYVQPSLRSRQGAGGLRVDDAD